MTKRRVIAYVDGFNFYYRRLRNKPYRWLDLCKFFEQFFPDDELVQVRYFTARVGGKFDPSKPLRQQAYLKALQTLPRVSITEGKFLTTQVQYRLAEPLQDADGNVRHSAKVWKQDEKGSDVNLGSYLLNEAWEDKYDVAIVVTNDSDLAVSIQMAVKRGKTVIVLHPDSNPARSLEASASGCLHIHDAHLSTAQFPDVIRLDNGKIITKPDSF
jgi:NYN domain